MEKALNYILQKLDTPHQRQNEMRTKLQVVKSDVQKNSTTYH
ncbi:hypothetical protein [Bacillus sp. FJAT-50079]|nr:hypothetical protein [Bacillus sp. FJAT-50079]